MTAERVAAHTLLILALVADDDELVRSITMRLLQRLGWACEAVASGEAVLAAIDAEPDRFALVVMDVSMPGMGGIHAADTLRAKGCALPLLFMSGADANDELGARLDDPRTAFVVKPCTLDELRRSLASLPLG